MCYAAPGIIYLLDRMGVPFSPHPEGLLDFRRFRGTLHNRTAFAGATTGQQLLYALDEQVPALRGQQGWSPSTSTGSGWAW
jgi:succinate dehydrogenase / fumarate reductase flavoprotein subunit